MEGTFTIQWDRFRLALPDLAALVAYLGPGDFPAYSGAAEALAADAERRYVGYCLGEPTPSGRVIARPSGALARGVSRNPVGLLQWVLRNDAPHAKAIEEGTPERDMKAVLKTSPKARRAKDGTLYLIVPFRHGGPTSKSLRPMPPAVYQVAKAMTHSRSLGAPTTRTGANGFEVPKFTYRWGGRLSEKAIARAGLGEAEQRRYGGMVRMGRSGPTSYMTFRVMSERSPQGAWVQPATPGLWPMKAALVAAWAQGLPGLKTALEADVAEVLGWD